jgi:hypothetical protein
MTSKIPLATKMYPITSVCKDDIIIAFEGEDLSKTQIKNIYSLDDNEMKWLASEIANDFCECCYWNIIRERTKQLLEDKE